MENHLLKYLKKGLRYDNRKLDEFRKIEIETGVSKSAEGSVRVKLGETEVIAGLKVELGTPFPDKPDEGSIMINVELAPMSNPEFESGPPSIDAIEMARVVDRGIRESKAVNFKKLVVEKGEKVWMLLIDVITVNDAGNLLDAAGIAAMAAIVNAKFPKVVDGVIDYHEKTNEGMPLEKKPVSVTVYKVGDEFILDPTYEEEKYVDGRLTVAVTEDGKLCAMQKGKDSPMTTEQIDKAVKMAVDKSKELRKELK